MKIAILSALPVLMSGVAKAQDTPKTGTKSAGVLVDGVFRSFSLLTVEADTQTLFGGKVLEAKLKELVDKRKNNTLSDSEKNLLDGYLGWARDWNQYAFLDRIARGIATTADDVKRQEKYGIFVRRARVDDQSRIYVGRTRIDPRFAVVIGEWVTSESVVLQDEALVMFDANQQPISIEKLLERRRFYQQLLDSYAHAYYEKFAPETVEEALKELEK